MDDPEHCPIYDYDQEDEMTWPAAISSSVSSICLLLLFVFGRQSGCGDSKGLCLEKEKTKQVQAIAVACPQCKPKMLELLKAKDGLH